MYRRGLGADLDEDARDFVNSLYSDADIASFDVAGTEAHVMMLYRSGIISRSDAKKILAVLREMRQERMEETDPGKNIEDCHELLEHYISKRAGSEAGGKLQTARSRNDQVALAIRMKLRHDTNMIQELLLQVVEALLEMAEDNKKTIVPLYTHLQHAQVGVLSHYFLAHADALVRDFDRLAGLYERLNQNPLGSGPAGGTSLPIDRRATTEMLAFDSMQENSLDSTSSRDHVSEFVSCMAIMMVNLSRMAEDFVVWSSNEFSFISISDDLASPSSIMPQKKNPDTLELVRGKAASAIGYLASVLAIQKGLPTGYNRDLQEVKEFAWTASDNAQGALRVLFNVLTGMEINKGRMNESAEAGHIMALDVAERLVERNVPFRRAHSEVAALVAAARAKGKDLSELTRAEIEEGSSLEAGAIMSVLARCATEDSAYGRRSAGSTATGEQSRMIKRRKKELAGMFDAVERQRQRVEKGVYRMWEDIEALLGKNAAQDSAKK